MSYIFLDNIKSLNKSLDVDLLTIVPLGLIGFYLVMTVQAVIVFKQFTVLNVLSVSLAFVLVFISLLFLFLRKYILEIKFKITLKSLGLSVFLVFLLLIMTFSEGIYSFFSFAKYYPTYPLLRLDQGLGYHPDAAFHVSIIQNIINFGYPSIGQHNTPLIVYHVLSHYVDALILKITNVEPYDSYGMFFHFKKMVLIASIASFVYVITKNFKGYIFFILFLVLAPIIIGTWHAIGSHGLWFTSIILILSAKYVFDSLNKIKLTSKDYTCLFLLGILISIGKISSGLMFSVYLGTFILLKDYKNFRVYLLGMAWVLFFLTYQHFIPTTDAMVLPKLTKVVIFLEGKAGLFYPRLLYSIYIIIVFLAFSSWLYKSSMSLKYLFSTILALLILSFVTQASARFNHSEYFYFTYGLAVPVLLLGFQSLLHDFNKKAWNFNYFLNFNHYIFKLLFALFFIGSTYIMYKPNINIFNLGYTSILKALHQMNEGYFHEYNLKFNVKKSVSLKKLLVSSHLDFPNKKSRGILNFRDELYRYLENKHLKKNEVLLFIPKEVFKSSLSEIGGPSWALGMLVYAITGVPLLHGIESLKNDYGYFGYKKTATWKSINEFNNTYTCINKKKIIRVNNLNVPDFELLCT
ncbi:hypothetical protein FOG18_07290 [Legionella israelensis]|uniref:hypothetical protein n=1 Tax=Legionella israelensis TaxID=454 RepID=UPI00118154B5|nr:hypothetical protein [Legionella israelensis]QDP72375.1 hypothetical protein FOG18_07290 [Legionella israelensis]